MSGPQAYCFSYGIWLPAQTADEGRSTSSGSCVNLSLSAEELRRLLNKILAQVGVRKGNNI